MWRGRERDRVASWLRGESVARCVADVETKSAKKRVAFFSKVWKNGRPRCPIKIGQAARTDDIKPVSRPSPHTRQLRVEVVQAASWVGRVTRIPHVDVFKQPIVV